MRQRRKGLRISRHVAQAPRSAVSESPSGLPAQ